MLVGSQLWRSMRDAIEAACFRQRIKHVQVVVHRRPGDGSAVERNDKLWKILWLALQSEQEVPGSMRLHGNTCEIHQNKAQCAIVNLGGKNENVLVGRVLKKQFVEHEADVADRSPVGASSRARSRGSSPRSSQGDLGEKGDQAFGLDDVSFSGCVCVCVCFWRKSFSTRPGGSCANMT